MIFLHTEKEPVHDYVRQAPFLLFSYNAVFTAVGVVDDEA